LLVVRCPVLVAPAMNDRMYTNAIVQENIARLRARGYEFVDPEEGYLACGSIAVGRLADPARILDRARELLGA
jgi:phosphopantothenoylcysteine decarboxylase/phosphopantothenate--cysteine ligase